MKDMEVLECVQRRAIELQGVWSTVFWGVAEGMGWVHLEKRSSVGTTLLSTAVCKGGSVSAFGNGDRMGGDGLELHHGMVRLGIRNNFFFETAVMQWHSCPRRWWGHHPWRCSRTMEM